jgi:hypothetical protein
MTGEELETALARAGIRPTEAAEIFRVTRATLTRWFAGVTPKQVVVYDVAVQITKVLLAAVKMGRLPMSTDVKGKARLAYVRMTVKEVSALAREAARLSALTPAPSIKNLDTSGSQGLS